MDRLRYRAKYNKKCAEMFTQQLSFAALRALLCAFESVSFCLSYLCAGVCVLVMLGGGISGPREDVAGFSSSISLMQLQQ